LATSFMVTPRCRAAPAWFGVVVFAIECSGGGR
jgi:hypothetical protein